MTWANPSAFWFLLLIPMVILLYFLKLQRERVIVSSTLLWARALQDRRVNSPFQRLRKSLLLLLQILVILILVGALAEPRYESQLFYGRTHLLLLDTSASMGTVENGRTRLELAQDAAREYVQAIPDGESAVLIRFAVRARAVTPVTQELGLVEDAIRDQRVSGAATRLDEAMELALSIARNLPDARAVIFSDGAVPPWGTGEVALPIDYRPVGTPQPNAGVVALSTRLDLSGSGLPQVFVEVRNFGSEAVHGFVSIVQQETVMRAAEADIPPGERWNQSFEARGAGLIEVVWEADDADSLAADDRAWVNVEPQRELRVWRTGEPNFLLDAGLESIPLLRLTTVPVGEIEAELRRGSAPPDVIVWERAAPTQLPEVATGHLFVGAIPPGIWLEPPVVRSLPQVVSWDRTHPVNRFLNYNTFQIAESWVLPPAPNTTALVEIAGGALISSFRTATSRGITVAFDSLQSTWHTDLGYSLFLYNALMFLAESDLQREATVRSEELLSVRAPASTTPFRIRAPDGTRVERSGDAQGWLRYTETEILGPYEVAWEERGEDGAVVESSRVIPVNLLVPQESDITPRPSLAISGRAVEGAQVRSTTRVADLWPWLIALALLCLLGEWYYFHRR
ncbi:MAG: VWA domain-containing protein [Planctomycetota bacterium]